MRLVQSANEWEFILPSVDLKHLALSLIQSKCEIYTCWGELYVPPQSESRIAILLSKLSLSWLPSMLFRNPLCCEFLFSFLTFEAQACPFGDISLHCFSYCTAAETELTELNFSGVSSMTVSLHIVSYIYAWTETLVCVCKDIFKLIGEWILYIIN